MSDRCYHGVTPAEECTECIEPESSRGYAQGRASDERAAIVAWLRGKAHDPTWLRAHGVQSRQGVCTLEEAADDIERGKHEVDEPDQCTDCGALIVGAHGCQGRPGGAMTIPPPDPARLSCVVCELNQDCPGFDYCPYMPEKDVICETASARTSKTRRGRRPDLRLVPSPQTHRPPGAGNRPSRNRSRHLG